MRRAGLSLEAGKQSSCQMHLGDPRHPEAAGSRWPSLPIPLQSQGCWAPPARARRVIFEDEVMPARRPLRRVAPAEEGEKLGAGSVPPGLASRPGTVPDYVVKYPAIRSRQQREGYKGVFQDQLAEYMELLGEVRTARRRLGELNKAMGQLTRQATSRTDGSRAAHVWCEYMKKRDLAFLEKQQRCEYLKKKLTHIKARIQEYDCDARDACTSTLCS